MLMWSLSAHHNIISLFLKPPHETNKRFPVVALQRSHLCWLARWRMEPVLVSFLYCVHPQYFLFPGISSSHSFPQLFSTSEIICAKIATARLWLFACLDVLVVDE